MFWAEAVAKEVRRVVTVMPVTRVPVTPRLKRVWRRINKAKGPPTRAPTIPRRTTSQYLRRRAEIRLKSAGSKTAGKLQVRPGERDTHNGHGKQDRRDEVAERQPPSGEKQPHDVADHPQRAGANVFAAEIFAARHGLIAERQ